MCTRLLETEKCGICLLVQLLCILVTENTPISIFSYQLLHEFVIIFLVLQTGDLANANASESDKIAAMMQQSGELFQPDQ